MLNNLFIIYANNSLRDNPENIYKIFGEIYPYFNPDTLDQKETLNLFGSYLIDFTQTNDPKKAEKLRKEYYGNISDLEIDIAYESVYNYRDGYCPKKCIEYYGPYLAETAQKWEYGGDKRLKCIECRQLFFRDLLFQLANGENFRGLKYPNVIDEKQYKAWQRYHKKFRGKTKVKIGDRTTGGFGFKSYIDQAFDCVGQKIHLSDNGQLEKTTFIEWKNLFGVFSSYPLNTRFNDFITSLVGFSLTDFLLNNEREKLKICLKCKNFFIASKNDLRIKYCPECSPKSKKTLKERAEYQREYRKKKKQKTLAEEKEKEIKRLMKGPAGCTREEAIEIIEADS